VFNKRELSVSVGSHRIDNSEASQRVHEVQDVVVHDNYTYGYLHPYNVVLLRLNPSIDYNRQTRPICVDDSPFPDTVVTCIVTGWGSVLRDGISRTMHNNISLNPLC